MSGLVIGDDQLRFQDILNYVFDLENRPVEISESSKNRVRSAHARFKDLLAKGAPIYGVTTGFGDSCFRAISPDQSEELQANLVSYLSCGSGALLPREATKAAMLFRLKSFCRGYSGVSLELVERLKLFLDNNWIPAVPRQGSLGASGDLIPLAYVARALQGQGYLLFGDDLRRTEDVLNEAGIPPYKLKPKEGIALVNGTSTMAGLSLVLLQDARFLTSLAAMSSSWLALALGGRAEAFDRLVNEQAKFHSGQTRVAARIRSYFEAENYQPKRAQDIRVNGQQTEELIQDRYSLRCTPQILGPVVETVELVQRWLETEVSGVSDNPLIGDDGQMSLGGNFYGGYLSQGMDYLKISLAQIADLYDRQLTMLIDEKSNRGLPPNLSGAKLSERALHHGLKGLHQSVNALTSEIMPKALANSIFSRSSESHNQDKVSLGMSAANQCQDLLESLYTCQSLYLICLVQALDLRKIKLQGAASRYLYDLVRSIVPFVEGDRALDEQVDALTEELKQLAPFFERKFEAL